MARGQIEDGATGAAVAETTMTTMTMMMIMAVCDTGRRGRWHDAVPVAMLDNSIVTVVIVTPSLMMFLYGTERMYIVTSGNFIGMCVCVCYRCEVARGQPVDPNLC